MNRRSIVTAAAASAVFAWSTKVARRRTVSPSEERIFRRANEKSDDFQLPVWAVMQAGSLAAVHVAAVMVLRRGDRRAAATVALFGTGVWGGVKAVKPLVGRGRPHDHLAAVNVRGQAQRGLGFPSGHAAVSLTLALTGPWSSAERALAIAVAGVTGGGRMYVGAHLPLDVAGGFAIAAIVASMRDLATVRGAARGRS